MRKNKKPARPSNFLKQLSLFFLSLSIVIFLLTSDSAAIFCASLCCGLGLTLLFFSILGRSAENKIIKEMERQKLLWQANQIINKLTNSKYKNESPEPWEQDPDEWKKR